MYFIDSLSLVSLFGVDTETNANLLFVSVQPGSRRGSDDLQFGYE
jgi:hypothetical protein